jgi:choline dehydrogenase
MAPCVVIGERAADEIKSEHGMAGVGAIALDEARE